jgi:hypothetical protein
MQVTRGKFLAAIALLLVGVLVGRWVGDWGLVTVNVRDVPLVKVLRSIEKQGGVKIATNADPNALVTMKVEKVPVFEAIDVLAISVDGEARLAYVAAPDQGPIRDVLAAFAASGNPGGWKIFAAGFGGGRFGDSEILSDPRTIRWTPSDLPEKTLHALLDQGAQKTGLLFAAPEAWNPPVTKLPGENAAGDVAAALVSGVRGKMSEVFLVTVSPPRSAETQNPEGRRWEFSRTVFSPQRGGGSGNPDWANERAQAQIAALPPEERPAAERHWTEMRAFWESIRNLPEEERRARMEEHFNKPEVQDRMEARQNARDAKSPPERREDRMRRYLDRKNQMKGNAAQS